MNNVETFTESRKHWNATVTVTRTPASLSESRMARARWFDYVGDHVIECFNVEVTVTHFYAGNPGEPRTETFFEIVTPHGRGCVVRYGNGVEELNVFIPNSGKALLYGFWKKHKHMVGHAGYYVRAMHVNADSRTRVDHTCPAQIYSVAAKGKPLGA